MDNILKIWGIKNERNFSDTIKSCIIRSGITKRWETKVSREIKSQSFQKNGRLIPYHRNCCDSQNSVHLTVMIILCCEIWISHLGNITQHSTGNNPTLAWEYVMSTDYSIWISGESTEQMEVSDAENLCFCDLNFTHLLCAPQHVTDKCYCWYILAWFLHLLKEVKSTFLRDEILSLWREVGKMIQPMIMIYRT